MKLDIVNIYRLINKKEMKKFGDFIRSPFFNSEPRFIKLYELIKSERDGISREIIARKIFAKNTSTSDTRFRKLVSEFMKLFERFLAEIEFSYDDLSRNFALLEKIKKLNLRREHFHYSKKIKSYIEDKTIKDELYYKNLIEIYAKRYAAEGINYRNWNEDLSFNINEYSDRYFIAMKLFVFRRFQGLEQTFSIDIKDKMSFYESIINYIESKKEDLKENDPEIYLRYLEYMIHKNGYNEEMYNEFLDILDKKSKQFQINEDAFYSSLLNILSGFINNGMTQYDKKVIELADLIDSKGIYRKSGITYTDLKVITECAIGEGRYEWAIKFAERVKDFIKHENKETIFKLISGKLYFFNKEYSEAKKHLALISMNDFTHYIEGKLIQCRIEYETGNLIAVCNLLNTVKKFLNLHTEIGKDFKNAYSIFTTILFKLVRIREKTKHTDIYFELDKIHKIISHSNMPIYANQWLLEEILKIRESG